MAAERPEHCADGVERLRSPYAARAPSAGVTSAISASRGAPRIPLPTGP